MVAYSFKAQFIGPIAVGLSIDLVTLTGLPIAAGIEIKPKRQTIRANGKRRHARPGEELQLYYAMRTKQCRLIGRARCVSVHDIRITVNEHTMPVTLEGAHVGMGYLLDFARQDGFESGEDMHQFWKKEHGLGKFEGVLIRWEPLTN